MREDVRKLGDYPHSKLVPTMKEAPQGTRMLKLMTEDCSCIVRTTRKHLEQDGSFKCPHDNEMFEEVKPA